MKRNVSHLQILAALAFVCSNMIQNLGAAEAVVAWGDNSRSQTVIPASLTSASMIVGGSFHSLALKRDGTVTGWGDNSFGAISIPAGLTNVSAVAAGNGFSLALKTDGSVTAWGKQTTTPLESTLAVKIAAAADNALALKSDGTVLAWGTVSNVPDNLTNVVAIAVGSAHDLALKADGTVVAWGDNFLGRATVPVGLSNVVAIGAGEYHSLALKADGTLVAWGDNTYGQKEIPSGLSNVVEIAVGAFHNLALKQDGTVVPWGNSIYGQNTLPSGLSRVKAIAEGRYHSLAIAGDGAPAITVPPANQHIAVDETATFRVMAVGTAPLHYQWQRNGTNLFGETGSVLVLTNVQLFDAGYYSVIVSNSIDSVESPAATLTLLSGPPLFVVQPEDENVQCNKPAKLQAFATGTPPLSYQWQLNGTSITGATNPILAVDHASSATIGEYTLVATNAYGSATSHLASLTVDTVPPLITSPLSASGAQGVPFMYLVTGLNATSFSTTNLPRGLTFSQATATIIGTPMESGVFHVVLTAANPCVSADAELLLTIDSGAPTISSPLVANGVEKSPFSYQIAGTKSPASFAAVNLPPGLGVNTGSGLISGVPTFAGNFTSTISASNEWGWGTATLQIMIQNAPITGLSIAHVAVNYSSPYLLDFQFSLKDNDDPSMGSSIVADPRLLSVQAFENEESVSPSETSVIIQRAGAGVNTKLIKAYLVLDFSQSIASLENGDTNSNGLSDAIESMVNGSINLVNQLPSDAQIGVYEFHREDATPQQVASLTTDKTMLNEAIGGIWTNYVQGFSAGSRCWDALASAITDLGPTNSDEQHYIVFVSDGRDESSTKTVDDVVAAATNANVQIYCVGFGKELDTNSLQTVTSATQGQLYTATNAAELSAGMAQIGKDLAGQYVLRWATLKRSSTFFAPSFQITYQGYTADSPTNPYYADTNNPIIDTTVDPPTTNYNYITNYIIPLYSPTVHEGDIKVGQLRLVPNADIHPAGFDLRAAYIPRYVRQFRLHFRPNWPITIDFSATNTGQLLPGWSVTETSDGVGGQWLLLSSPNPQDTVTSAQFASFGRLLTFLFRDKVDASNSFSFFNLDNTIYTNTGDQSFVIVNSNSFTTFYDVLPHGTPIPWPTSYGFSGDLAIAETNDPDGDGMLTWQEYRAGTDPLAASSRLEIRSLPAPDPFNHFEIAINTALGRVYRVESSTDFITWQTVEDNIVGTGGNVTVNDYRDPIGHKQTYYRVLVYY